MRILSFYDENDVFSYLQLLIQLSEMQDQVDVEEVLNLLTKIVDVQLPERKGIVKDVKVTTDEAADSLEDSFRERVISEFPSLCADSLPHDDGGGGGGYSYVGGGGGGGGLLAILHLVSNHQ